MVSLHAVHNVSRRFMIGCSNRNICPVVRGGLLEKSGYPNVMAHLKT